jgi:hypothetical protein
MCSHSGTQKDGGRADRDSRTARFGGGFRAAKRMGTDSHPNGFDARRRLQWLHSLARLLSDCTSRGVAIIGNREKHRIGPRTSMGHPLLDDDRVGKHRFLVSALRGRPFDQHGCRLFSRLNRLQESLARQSTSTPFRRAPMPQALFGKLRSPGLLDWETGASGALSRTPNEGH